jgi:hypothetical protein
MALTKVTYDTTKREKTFEIESEAGQVFADADNLNDIQDEVIAQGLEIDVLQTNNGVATLNGGTGQKAIPVNGATLITGGTGIADMTLAAPAANSHVIIRLNTLTSGSVVITTAAGVTFNGTNNTCTMNAVDDWIELVYASATAWAVVRSNSIALSSV